MREIALDTETTGLDPTTGDRVVEIGAVELYNHMPTGKTFHKYLNPDRMMPKDAFEIHGLSDDFLRDKPRFRDVAQDFLAFIGDATLVIHNAPFDMKFLNHELGAAGHPTLPMSRAFDTVMLARQKFPGSPASLDALCRRFGVDNSKREKHGALLDSEILAEVYLELIGGRQPDLVLNAVTVKTGGIDTVWRAHPRPNPLASRLTAAESAAHEAYLSRLGGTAIWKK
ncbi:MAG: DNA polymerase III subunit epsilon [Candidatus Saccharibacteria bacterium]|nr:DNA polymerase III subunit epsilon [Pseudorhodobacter sp.]